MGGTLDYNEQENSFSMDTPSGYVWRANGCTCIAVQWANNHGQTWMEKALKDDADRWEMGMEKVTDPAELKRIRWELGEDEWGAADEAPERIEWPKHNDQTQQPHRA